MKILEGYDVTGIVAVGTHPTTNQLLVVREPDNKPAFFKTKGQISVPMGTIELGETPEQTLIHELMDETGNNFLDKVIIGILSFIARDGRKVGLLVYAVRLAEDCSAKNFAHFMDRQEFLALPESQVRIKAHEAYYLFRIAEKLTNNDIFGKKDLVEKFRQSRKGTHH